MADHYYTATPTSEHDLRTFEVNAYGRDLRFTTDSGVFSREHLDPGTILLAKSIPDNLSGTALDVGCGWGALSILTLCRMPDLRFTLCDINERALDLCRRNLQQNGFAGDVLASDGLENIRGDFDVILTNPPIRAGKAVIYKMFRDSYAHLKVDGQLFLVIRKQQGAPSCVKYLQTFFDRVQVIKRDAGYWILQCDKLHSMLQEEEI